MIEYYISIAQIVRNRFMPVNVIYSVYPLSTDGDQNVLYDFLYRMRNFSEVVGWL